MFTGAPSKINFWWSPPFQWYVPRVTPAAVDSFGTMMPAPTLESATLQTFHIFVEGNSVSQMDVDVDNQNLSLVPYNARCDVFDSSTGYYYDNVRIDLRGNTTASFSKKSHGLRFNKSQPLTCTDPVTGTKVKEIRNKILFTLGMLLIYRIGSAIPVPGVDYAKLSAQIADNSILSMMNTQKPGHS